MLLLVSHHLPVWNVVATKLTIVLVRTSKELSTSAPNKDNTQKLHIAITLVMVQKILLPNVTVLTS